MENDLQELENLKTRLQEQMRRYRQDIESQQKLISSTMKHIDKLRHEKSLIVDRLRDINTQINRFRRIGG
jgi:predicted  nucleic acid-binding Zn-ribbon protein